MGSRGAETRIIVTQPRRIAAISVAERVASERLEGIGHSIGYSVRFSHKPPRENGGSIEFMTTGIVSPSQRQFYFSSFLVWAHRVASC